MPRSRFISYRFAGLLVVMVLIMVQSVGIARVRTSQPSQRTTNINLDSEFRALDGFLDDWLKFHKQQLALTRKSSINNTEFNTLKSSSEGLRNRCSEFQTAVRDLVRKLKEAGRWNSLDEEILAKSDNERFKSGLREGGGPKRILEDASSQFCNQAKNEITEPVERLRPKLSAQTQQLRFPTSALSFVGASYQPPAPAFKYAFRCTGSIIRILARMAVGKDQFEGQAYKNWECFCMEECGTASPT